MPKKNPSASPEKAIMNETLVALSALPETLVYRNNTGQAWQGKRMRLTPGQMFEFLPGMVVLLNARPIDFGMPGSGDIMGVHSGVPLAVENKTALGEQSDLQINFETAWTKAGGLYVIARSPQEAVAKVLLRG